MLVGVQVWHIPIQVRNYGWLMFGFAVFSTGIPPGCCGIAGSHAQLRWRELVSIPSSSRPLREGPPRPLKAPWCCYGHAACWQFYGTKTAGYPLQIGIGLANQGDEMEYLDSDDLTRKNWSAGRGKSGSCCNSATHVYRKPRETCLW